jgi:putative transposase
VRACRLLGVSRSGFYQFRGRQIPRAKDVREQVYVRAAFAASYQTYGSRRVMHAVRARGLNIGRHRVRTLMKQAELRPRWRRRFVTTTHSNPNFRAAKNTLNRQFSVAQPDRAWVTDVTYVDTARGWLYIAAVLDLYSRKVVGWAGSPHLHAEVAVEALHRAILERHPPLGLLMHSDRGSQYTSDTYQRFLRQYGMQCSMSRSGNCWDNAVMERFFLSLKKECVWQQRYANREEAIKDIGYYINHFYNPVRLHSTLGYLAPDVYEKTQAKNTPLKLSAKT